MRGAALALVALAAVGCATGSHEEASKVSDTQAKTDDRKLVERVRGAVAARVAPDSIEAFVGAKPIYNTATGSSLAMLRRVDFQADPQHPGETVAVAGARAIVYWARPVEGNDPHVVGVRWGEDGAATVFFAVIPPP